MSSCVEQAYAKKSDGTRCTVPYCKITNGECQFLKDNSWKSCPIYAAYHEQGKI